MEKKKTAHSPIKNKQAHTKALSLDYRQEGGRGRHGAVSKPLQATETETILENHFKV